MKKKDEDGERKKESRESFVESWSLVVLQNVSFVGQWVTCVVIVAKNG